MPILDCVCVSVCVCVCVCGVCRTPSHRLTGKGTSLSLPCFFVQNKNCKNMNSVQQQREHHHWKVLIESFNLSGYTFRFRWTVQKFSWFS